MGGFFEKFKGLSKPDEKPHTGEIEEARRTPNGYVYRIAGNFAPDEAIPGDAIVGAWKVNARGEIEGKFILNDKYNAERWPPFG